MFSLLSLSQKATHRGARDQWGFRSLWGTYHHSSVVVKLALPCEAEAPCSPQAKYPLRVLCSVLLLCVNAFFGCGHDVAPRFPMTPRNAACSTQRNRPRPRPTLTDSAVVILLGKF